ncbi:Octaprenyl-diphosphate synthase [Moellerella wisconsensis]|nr:Octaprenyl-diphosphate synthase [Moellerella wisconsensis]
MNLESIIELTADDMSAVNEVILGQLTSDVALINQLGYYIVSGGGKRIRPMIAVLAGRALGHNGKKTRASCRIDRIYSYSDIIA